MTSNQPIIILIHGAFHLSSCFFEVKHRLEALSYPVLTIDLPTTNPTSLHVNYTHDVKAIHEVILPLLDQGRDVVLVAHSYGGVPAYVCTEGHSITERAAAGKRGGIRSVVFLCAFAIPEKGNRILDVNRPSDVSWTTMNKEGYMVCTDWAKTVLYEDLTESERDYWYGKLCSQSPLAHQSPVHFSARQLTVPSIYLLAEKDRAIRPEVQQKMIDAIPGVKCVRVASGHSPFLSHPRETVDAIVEGAQLKEII